MCNILGYEILWVWLTCMVIVNGEQWNSSYDELLQLFSLPTLQECKCYMDLSTIFIIVHNVLFSIWYFCRAESESYKITVLSVRRMLILMHIQINTITLYLVPFVAGIYLPHLYFWLVCLYHPLKVAFGHACKIIHFCYIVCPLLLHKSLKKVFTIPGHCRLV